MAVVEVNGIPSEWGEPIAFIDESEDYAVDMTAIHERDGRFLYATADGCSCWAGEWEIEEFDTLDALEESARGGEGRDYNATWKGLDELMREAREAMAARG